VQTAEGEVFSGGPGWQFAPKKATDSPRARPFLTGSAPQTEFDVTRSKQTPENFLTGSRTAIKLFKFCTARTQNLAEVNRCKRRVTPANTHSLAPTQEGSLITDFSFSTRFCPISRKRRNSLKTNARRISTRSHNHLPLPSQIVHANEASVRLHALAGHPTSLSQHEYTAHQFGAGRESMGSSLMKKVASGIVASLVLLGFAFAAQKSATFSGEISDRYCAKAGSHESMMKTHGVKTIEECIPACVKAGGKYVLVDSANNTVYALDDQQKPAAFARQKVKVTGTLEKATQTIHVENIEPEK
jgi:hypothetical protein